MRHDRAHLKASDKSQLESNFGGDADLVEGKRNRNQVGFVRTWNPAGSICTGVTDEAIAVDASGYVSVWLNGADSTANIVAELSWMHGSQAISLGKEVKAEWYHDARKW